MINFYFSTKFNKTKKIAALRLAFSSSWGGLQHCPSGPTMRPFNPSKKNYKSSWHFLRKSIWKILQKFVWHFLWKSVWTILRKSVWNLFADINLENFEEICLEILWKSVWKFCENPFKILAEIHLNFLRKPVWKFLRKSVWNFLRISAWIFLRKSVWNFYGNLLEIFYGNLFEFFFAEIRFKILRKSG